MFGWYPKKMVKSCWICKTSGNKLKKSYFRVPKILYHRNAQISQLSALRREKWHKVLALPYESSGIRICSDHFLSGTPSRLLDVNDPDWIPTQKLTLKADKKYVIAQEIEKIRQVDKVERSNMQAHSLKCRLCTKIVNNESYVNIFQPVNKHILKMISMVLGYELFPDDKTSFGCWACLKKIQICYKLLTFFRNNEKCLDQAHPTVEHNDFDLEMSNSVKSVSYPDILQQDTMRKNLGKITEISSNREEDTSVKENLNMKHGDVEVNDNLYDRELIRSIVDDHSASSDEEPVESRTITKYEKRKYDVQAVKVRPLEIKTLKCNNCYKKFINLNDLKMHKNFCKLFYCQLCKPQIFFKDKNDQVLHKKRYHSHPLICHICGKNYSQSYLVKHFKNHFEDKRKCPCCDKMLKNSTILMTHIDNVHGRNSNNICEFCGECFKNLKKHLISCRDIKS